MILITDEQREMLLENGRKSAADLEGDFDPKPVVKLFTPDGACTWLITELDPEEPDIAFGLCDLGMGSPELGSVRISEIKSLRGALGLPAERDLFFEPKHTIGAYAKQAWKLGRIDVAF